MATHAARCIRTSSSFDGLRSRRKGSPMSRKAIGLAGLLLGACALGAGAFWQYGVWAQERERQREAEAAAAKLQAEQEARARLPHADLDMAGLPKGYPRPASAWRTAEKAVYRDVV